MELKDIELFATDFKANASEREAILTKWSQSIAAAGK